MITTFKHYMRISCNKVKSCWKKPFFKHINKIEGKHYNFALSTGGQGVNKEVYSINILCI